MSYRFQKRYVHIASGYKETFVKLQQDVHVLEFQGYIEADGSFFGVIYPAKWDSLKVIENTPGVTLFPALHDPNPLHPTKHVPLLAHVGVVAGDSTWVAAQKLYAHYKHEPLRPDLT